jgi:hypothetical protein
MKYQVGDEIVVLLTQEEGKVVEIVNDKMVLIEVKGVRFPAYTDQIDFPYFLRFTKNLQHKQAVAKKEKQFVDNLPKEKPIKRLPQANDGIWLQFVPKFALDDFNDEVVELFKVFLVNKTDTAYRFSYQQLLLAETVFSIESESPAHSDFYLNDLKFEDLNDSPTFTLEFALSKPNRHLADYYETQLKLKGKQVFKQVEDMKTQNKPFLSYLLFKEYPIKQWQPPKNELQLSKLTGAGFKVYSAKEAKNNLPAARSVVDLHIEKITDNWQGMSNFEILTLQLNEFDKWFNIAVANRLANFTIIHGVGSGNFVNQYSQRFGHGATEIFFK